MIDTVAADLRNAAFMLEVAGHNKGFFVNNTNGSMCIGGAIKMATTSRLVRNQYGYYEYTPLPDGWLGMREREDAAMSAVSQLLPDNCEVEHESANGDWPFCPHTREWTGKIHGDSRVFHYNDYVCKGGEEAIRLLRDAADLYEATTIVIEEEEVMA